MKRSNAKTFFPKPSVSTKAKPAKPFAGTTRKVEPSYGSKPDMSILRSAVENNTRKSISK